LRRIGQWLAGLPCCLCWRWQQFRASLIGARV